MPRKWGGQKRARPGQAIWINVNADGDGDVDVDVNASWHAHSHTTLFLANKCFFNE